MSQQLLHHAAYDVGLAAVGHAAGPPLAPALAAPRVDPQARGEAGKDGAALGSAAPIQQLPTVEAAVGNLQGGCGEVSSGRCTVHWGEPYIP